MTTDKDALTLLAEKPWTRSTVEEVCGLLWAILATLSPITPVSAVAWVMAAISMLGAISYAVAAIRARTQTTKGDE